MRKLRLLPLLAATYFMVSGGPYDLEDVIGYAGYGWALIILAVLLHGTRLHAEQWIDTMTCRLH